MSNVKLPPPPPLRNGDRLTRAEFERRYEAMPQVKKAELIDGVVHLPSPALYHEHGHPCFNMIAWLGVYAGATPGVEGGANGSLRLDSVNEPQPDALLIISPDQGGRVHIDSDGYIVGGPELVGEVAATSASYHLGSKLAAYERNGVREYLVWRVIDRAFDWFVWRERRFQPLALGPDDTYRSEVFPGLWLKPSDLINGDVPAIVQAAAQITARPGHAEFVARLQQAATRKD